MADVKSMRKQFEQNNNMSAGQGAKPSIAVKPVLQRFQQTKDDASPSNSSTASNSFQSGHLGPVKLVGLSSNMNVALKPMTNSGGDSPFGDKGRFKKSLENGQAPTANDDNNNNGNITTGASTPHKLPGITSSNSNVNETALRPKSPQMKVSNALPKPPKPSVLSSEPVRENQLDKSNSTTAVLDKNTHSKMDSISSNSSSTSSSTLSTNDSSSSPHPKSPPSNSETSGAFNFKSMLRKVDHAAGPPVKRVLSDRSSEAPGVPTPKSPVSPSSSNASSSSTNTEKAKTQSRVPPIPSNGIVVEMRSKQNEKVEEIIVRKSDGKKFRKISLPSNPPSTIPKKPLVPINLDLTSIREQYQNLMRNSGGEATSKNVEPVSEEVEVEEGDDVYWDGITTCEASPAPPLPQKPQPAINRISLIPEMSAEDEEGELPVYDDTPIEEDIYNEAMSEQNDKKHKLSVGSESQVSGESEQERKKRLKEEANAKKKEEKERKEKEKKEREEEKRRKKKVEEELKLRTKFNLTGQEKMVGEGLIKQDAKGGGLNLKVKKGQVVTIVRLDSNPPNKWLVKDESQLGYAESQNIEVDPNIIRQAMKRSEEDFDEQPTYDDVPQENESPAYEIEEEEEIYDLCS